MQAVLFDLDETLHDKTSTLNRMGGLQHAGFELSRQGVPAALWLERYVELNQIIMPKHEVFATLAAEFLLPDQLGAELLADYDRKCGAEAQPFPGMRALLEACLGAGAVLGCVTNGRDRHQRSKLEGLGVTELFTSIVTSEGFGTKKPDPAIFDCCLAELGVAPEHAAFVGDNFEADMQPAINLGMHAIWKSKQSASDVAFASDSLDEIRLYLLNILYE